NLEHPLVENYFTEQEPPSRLESCRNWYYNAMSKEHLAIPRGNTIRFSVWQIKSDDIGLFMLKNIRFDKLFFFVGEETIYWIFFKHDFENRNVQGTTPLTINYCSCCFNEQYLQFIDCIKGNLEENGYVVT
ncbi:hypothetical protein DOY81_011835, partial [Sarcophaga bullata]